MALLSPHALAELWAPRKIGLGVENCEWKLGHTVEKDGDNNGELEVGRVVVNLDAWVIAHVWLGTESGITCVSPPWFRESKQADIMSLYGFAIGVESGSVANEDSRILHAISGGVGLNRSSRCSEPANSRAHNLLFHSGQASVPLFVSTQVVSTITPSGSPLAS